MISVINDLVLPPLIALIVSATAVGILISGRWAAIALDYPNSRSLHAAPTPRLGGVGIMAGIGAAWAYALPALDPLLLISLVLLTAVSLLDDLKGASIAWRLLIHLGSATLATVAMLHGHAWWLVAAAALATAWMTNLYNFMDGADGMAGGMAVIGFGGYGAAAIAGGDLSFATTNLAIAAAALGFLLFNFPPARTFMGDTGAIPLGFLAAVMNVVGALRGDWPWWFGVVTFSPFIVDASTTLAKRILRGAKIWQAHREHYYQRLVRTGWGHRKTAYAEYALMAGCSGLALSGIRQGAASEAVILAAVAVLYTALIVLIEMRLPHDAKT